MELAVILICIAIYFPVSILVKRIILYNECSNIEEYRTREIVNDPDDYNLNVNRLIVRLLIFYYGKEETYYRKKRKMMLLFMASIWNRL